MIIDVGDAFLTLSKDVRASCSIVLAAEGLVLWVDKLLDLITCQCHVGRP